METLKISMSKTNNNPPAEVRGLSRKFSRPNPPAKSQNSRSAPISPYREGQEDQLGALGLVTNAVVLWNTLYMQEALSWMRKNGEETGVEDIARLSPLMHGHINMLGHYTFTLPEDILKGELR